MTEKRMGLLHGTHCTTMDPFGDGYRMDSDEDEEEEDQTPHWVPSILPETAARETQRLSDERACASVQCELCSILDHEDDECAQYIKRIYEMEEEYRMRINPSILYKIIAKKYNDTAYRQTVRFMGEEAAARKGFHKLTVPMVRRHYEQKHVRSPARTLWELIEYQQRCVEHLEKHSLWIINANDPAGAPQPNVANFNIVMKLNNEIRQNIILVSRLEKGGIKQV